jgi:hypothetical protein
LVVALEAGALAQGYATDLWTLGRVCKLIEKISGKRYSQSGVAAAQGTELYKFLFDLTGGGNWLVDVHASS